MKVENKTNYIYSSQLKKYFFHQSDKDFKST